MVTIHPHSPVSYAADPMMFHDNNIRRTQPAGADYNFNIAEIYIAMYHIAMMMKATQKLRFSNIVSRPLQSLAVVVQRAWFTCTIVLCGPEPGRVS